MLYFVPNLSLLARLFVIFAFFLPFDRQTSAVSAVHCVLTGRAGVSIRRVQEIAWVGVIISQTEIEIS